MRTLHEKSPIQLGRFEVRPARGPKEIAAARRLRYLVFYEAAGVVPPPDIAACGLDFDCFDETSDHLIVLDHRADEANRVVGNYRLRRQDVALAHGGFYSQGEFDLGPLLRSVPQGLLELGRACTHPRYRQTTLLMLLGGIAAYVEEHNIEYLFGCGSFSGSSPEEHAEALQFLHDHYLAPVHLRAHALPGDRYVPMDQGLPRRSLDDPPYLPPLMALYLSFGARVGYGGVIDDVMNTVDVCVILSTTDLTEKVANHFLGKRR